MTTILTLHSPAAEADVPPAISIMRPDYVVELKRVSFGRWKIADGHEVPMFNDDPQGRALVATKVERASRPKNGGAR